jgi:hypothetical protein
MIRSRDGRTFLHSGSRLPETLIPFPLAGRSNISGSEPNNTKQRRPKPLRQHRGRALPSPHHRRQRACGQGGRLCAMPPQGCRYSNVQSMPPRPAPRDVSSPRLDCSQSRVLGLESPTFCSTVPSSHLSQATSDSAGMPDLRQGLPVLLASSAASALRRPAVLPKFLTCTAS